MVKGHLLFLRLELPLYFWFFCCCYYGSGYAHAHPHFAYQNGITFNPSLNLTTSNPQQLLPDSRFHYRHHVANLNLGVFTDISLQPAEESTSSSSSSSSSTTLKLNGIVSAAYCLPFNAPAVHMAFFESMDKPDLGFFDKMHFSHDAAAYVGVVYDKLEEIDEAGTTITSHDFHSLSWQAAEEIKVVDSERGLSYVTYTADVAAAGATTVGITVAASSVLGVLNEGDGAAVITPAALETIFEVDGYAYQSASNHLRLTFYFIHASEYSGMTSDGSITAGYGAAQVYASTALTALVDGQSQSITLNGINEANIPLNEIPNTFIISHMKGFHGNSKMRPEVRRMTVDFSTGATAISYDPTVGFGNPYERSNPENAPTYPGPTPTPTPSSTPTSTPESDPLAPEVAALWMLLGMATLFAVFALLPERKKSGYTTI